MIVDTSVLLAILFKEMHGPWCATRLEGQTGLRMSTVNFAELLIKVQDLQPHLSKNLEELLYTFNIRYVPPSELQAKIAAIARLKYPLNLGDCFAYALAKEENLPLITLDRDFSGTDIQVILPT